MKFLVPLLFFCSSLFGQTISPIVQAGTLLCTAQLRAVDQVQTYCYAPKVPAPGLKLVHNTLNTLNVSIVDDFVWCNGPDTSNCNASHVTWAFQLKDGVVFYQVADGFGSMKQGSLKWN